MHLYFLRNLIQIDSVSLHLYLVVWLLHTTLTSAQIRICFSLSSGINRKFMRRNFSVLLPVRSPRSKTVQIQIKNEAAAFIRKTIIVLVNAGIVNGYLTARPFTLGLKYVSFNMFRLIIIRSKGRVSSTVPKQYGSSTKETITTMKNSYSAATKDRPGFGANELLLTDMTFSIPSRHEKLSIHFKKTKVAKIDC